MLNHFLARLDNDPLAPGGILWPTFTARSFGDAEASVRSALIGAGLGREQRFLRCLQLACLAEESPLAHRLTSRDPRVSYTRQFVRDRLRPSGTVVSYLGSNTPAPILSLTINATTPEMAAWTLGVAGGVATITDDLGRIRTTTITYAGGISNPLLLPLDRGHIQLSAVAPANGDSWEVAYKAPGASWVQVALTRLNDSSIIGLLDPECLAIYRHSPVAIDRLAAAVVALGDHP